MKECIFCYRALPKGHICYRCRISIISCLITFAIDIFALIYIISPWDFIPEIVLGPIGLADDAVVALVACTVFILNIIGIIRRHKAK